MQPIRHCFKRAARTALCCLALSPAFPARSTPALELHLRSLAESPPGSGQYVQVETPAAWHPAATAAVICDMWDRHWCRGATARVAEMAPRLNRLIHRLRDQGVLIIHCPSGTMKFYADTPQRQLAQSAPKVTPRVPLQGWCHLDPKKEAPLPIDDSDGGCDDEPQCPHPPYPWTRQIATIAIEAGDAITDNAEAYYLIRQRGITNVLVMGVHENMCVLGRPFSIRQLVQQGLNVALVRDLTDTMYNSRRRPFVSHFIGTDLVAWHIEKHWCPTITSDQILGGRPFRFAADTQPPRRFADFAYRFNRGGHPVDQYNIVWTSPSEDSSGSMPLGNGDLGLNVWVESGGDLLLLVSKTDAWDHKAQLLKLGRVRLHLSPNPWAATNFFRQELRLHRGEMVVRGGQPPNDVSVRLWVDAHHPVVRFEASGAKPFDLRATVELWRTTERALRPDEASGADQFASDEPPKVYPDHIVNPGNAADVLWYQRNERSIWAATLRHQGLAALIPQFHDPLLHRTFGGLLRGAGLTRTGATTIESAAPRRQFTLALHALTAQTDTPDLWVKQLLQQTAEIESKDWTECRQAHQQWWDEFWNRSWIRITGSSNETLLARKMTRNTLPLRIGADSEGGNRFHGLLGPVAVWNRALTDAEIQARAREFPLRSRQRESAETADRGQGAEGRELIPVATGFVAGWDWRSGDRKEFTSVNGARLAARVIGDVQRVPAPDKPGSQALRLAGQGYLETPHCAALDLDTAVTLEAWIRPDQFPEGGMRILDKSKAGTANGYLLDTYPANALRLIVEDGALMHPVQLPANQWSHVAAVYDARAEIKKLYLNGRPAAVRGSNQMTRPDYQIVSRGYILQRFINACGGRGGAPIKFNGSIFTVDVPGKFDPDYRRWGGCYWFQNTRLPYWPMLGSGDFDLMQPLFQMYREALPFARARTPIYFHHAGAFFPETMHFWGAYHNGGLGYGWNRAGQPVGRTVNQYIRYYWSGGLELLAMMLDHYAFTADQDFFQQTLLPHATAVLEFYAQHYPREPDGPILFAPAQALETWWSCENPLPIVAGLRFVLHQLLALPEAQIGARQLTEWRALEKSLPPLPLHEIEGRPALSPAEAFRSRHNSENPELYAIFPYRLYGIGKPDLDVAHRAFTHRSVKGGRGWQQDDTQAAFLGLANEARRMVTRRFATKDAGSRFPAFWGPNFDWTPDQTHGGNGLMALQTMLLQWDNRKLHLLPAWPKDWDVDFKLHAPFRTTVEGVLRQGKLLVLKVTPEERKQDLEIH